MAPRIVYFSSVTENTKIVIDRLPFPSQRIKLRAKDPEVLVDYPFIFFVPTYGGGHGEGAVPPQVRKFFQRKEHRDLCVGVVGSGNLLFGEKYGIAGDILADRLQVPMLYRFEIRGTLDDLEKIEDGITSNWEKLLEMKGISE